MKSPFPQKSLHNVLFGLTTVITVTLEIQDIVFREQGVHFCWQAITTDPQVKYYFFLFVNKVDKLNV